MAKTVPAALITSTYSADAKTNRKAGNTKGGSITVPLTSCLTGLELPV